MSKASKPIEPEGFKYCTRCKTLKQIEDFRKSPRCRQCNKECDAKYKEKYPERIVAKSAKYYQENKEQLNAKRRLRRRKYNPSYPSNSPEYLHDRYLKRRAEGKIKSKNKTLSLCKSPKTYAQMLEEQGGRCAICGHQPKEGDRPLVVDHLHSEKRVRKLLCHWCNTGLGMFKEHPDALENAIRYIETHSRVQGA